MVFHVGANSMQQTGSHWAHVQPCELLANQDAATEHIVSCSGLAGQPGCSIPPCDSCMSTWSPCKWMCEPHTCHVSSKLGIHGTCALNTLQASEPILNNYLLTSPYSRFPGWAVGSILAHYLTPFNNMMSDTSGWCIIYKFILVSNYMVHTGLCLKREWDTERAASVCMRVRLSVSEWGYELGQY